MPREKATPVQRLRIRVRHASGVTRVEASGEWTVAKLQAAVAALPDVVVDAESIYFVTEGKGAVVGGAAASKIRLPILAYLLHVRCNLTRSW